MKIAILLILPAVVLSLMTNLDQSTAAQGSGNVTAPIAPQGTSLGATGDNNATTTEPETSAGNVTAPIAPQGTSLGATGDNNATTTEPETSAGDVSESVAPG
jgi:hypothetical protein